MISAGLDVTATPATQAILYDAPNRRPAPSARRELPVRTAFLTPAFSPCWPVTTACSAYDASFGEPLVSIDSRADSVNCLAFAPDSNRYVYRCNDGGLVIRHTQTEG